MGVEQASFCHHFADSRNGSGQLVSSMNICTSSGCKVKLSPTFYLHPHLPDMGNDFLITALDYSVDAGDRDWYVILRVPRYAIGEEHLV